MILQIPVSSFSKKILLKEDPEPIRIDRFSIMHPCFMDIRYGKPERIYGAVQILNENIAFEINKRAPRNRLMYIYQAGLNIHRLHTYMMMVFIEGYIHSGRSVSEGIRKYFDMYDIWDEDMDIENTFRQWQRYSRAKKKKNILKNIASKKLQNNTLNSQKIGVADISIFHQELAELLYDNLHLFTTKDKKFKFKLYKSIKVYLMHHVLKYSIQNLELYFGVHHSNIYRNIESVENLIKYDAELGPQIKEMIS